MNSFTVGLYTAVPDHYPKINFLKKAVSMAIHFKSIWTTFIDVCARYYVSKCAFSQFYTFINVIDTV